jgi:glycosyltransferase involved in cell wall biosynthesis
MGPTVVRPEPINVVYVINSLRAGGAERFLCDLARHLDPDRFRAQIFCLYERGQFASAVEAANVPVHVIGVRRRVVPTNWVGVWRRLGGVKADIVHTHLHEATWYGLPTAYLRRVPVRVSHLQSSHWNWPRKLRWLDRAAEAFASTTLVCSAAVEEFAHVGLHYPVHKLELIPNGIDLDRFRGLPDREEARSALDLPQGCPILICVASLTEEKGQTYLLEAMQAVHAELPEARLLLVGRDRGKADLNALANEKGIGEHVTLLGTREDVPLLLVASDVSILPSLREGLPLSLLESAAARVPAVGTSVGGIPEVVEDGVGGILVPPRDPPALADALLTLLRDPERRRSMGDAARERVERKFDIRVIAGKIQDLYVSMLAAASRRDGAVSRRGS